MLPSHEKDLVAIPDRRVSIHIEASRNEEEGFPKRGWRG